MNKLRNFILHITLTFLLFTAGLRSCYAQEKTSFLKGRINNYANQPLYVYQCYGDTLLLTDSTTSDKNGEFVFLKSLSKIQKTNLDNEAGMYKIVLQLNQFFYILYNDSPIEIRTVYQSNAFFNSAMDSLTVLKSDENKHFYEFQHFQQGINIASSWLLQMMRLYPRVDSFHIQIENEYFKRYKAIEQFVFHTSLSRQERSPANLIAKAYYQPILPDWKQPDAWRDSIIALHYFDYFNPADPFYLNSNILPEKMDLFLVLATNKLNAYGQPIKDEMLTARAAQMFLEKTKSSRINFNFCLNYLLKKFSKEYLNNAFLF